MGAVSGSRSATVQMATSAITTTTTAAPSADCGAAAGGGHFQRGQFTIVGSLDVRTSQ